ncbi:MAG: hypothetical protein ACM3UP_00475, partial [Methanocella sp.]
LDTHAGDLSTYDPSAHAVLRNDRGAVVTKGFVWRTDTEGAHHRSGELRLPNRGPGGRLWDRNTKMIRLEIRDLRETPSRMFEWRFK